MDSIKKVKYIEDKNVTLVVFYRLNFSGKNCGYAKIFQGNTTDGFEIYMESYDCDYNENDIEKIYNRLIEEIQNGEIEL